MHGRGACMAGGMHSGGMHGGGECMAGGHAWQGDMCGRYYEIQSNEQAVHILLECILV